MLKTCFPLFYQQMLYYGALPKMVDALPEFETTDTLGSTDEFTGAVGTTPILIPSTPGNPIEEIGIRCAVDQTFNKRLEYSYDGINYRRLRVGEAREDEPRGGIAQVWIRAAGIAVTSVNYEIVMNRGLP